MPKTIIISIHPEYAEKILTGEKTYELRTRLPQDKPERMIIYATAPVSAVVGTAECWTSRSQSSGSARGKLHACPSMTSMSTSGIQIQARPSCSGIP